MSKMSKKVPIEIKAAILNYFLTKKCSIASLCKYGYFKHQKTIQQMIEPPKIGGTRYDPWRNG